MLQIKKNEAFGYLKVIKEAPMWIYPSGKKGRMFLCKCTACNEVIKEYRLSDLRTGHTKSCGCTMKERISSKNTKHGFRKSSLRDVYNNMIKRCYNKKHKQYPDYGGRGITVCKEWLKGGLGVFGTWAIENGYDKNLTIDRRNNDAGYSPENCRWVSRKINNNNKRNNIKCLFQGNSINFKKLWRIQGKKVDYNTAVKRFLRGMSPFEAVTVPLRRGKQSNKLFYFGKRSKAKRHNLM